MLTKQETFLNDDQLNDYCVSHSKYASKGYKTIVSKLENRTNGLSLIEGGHIVFIVDHKIKAEIAYPNVKSIGSYSRVIRKKFNPKTNYIKNLEEIYSVNQANSVKIDVYANGEFLA